MVGPTPARLRGPQALSRASHRADVWNVRNGSGVDMALIATIGRQRLRFAVVGRQAQSANGRLSRQCILAPYNLAPLNPRVDLPAPDRRRETTPIRGLRPILTSPRAYWSKARRALVFDSLHHPADAAPGAACPNGRR